LFDIGENKWSHPTETDGAPPGRQRHTACLVASKKLLIYAGFNGTRWLSDLYLLDIGKFEESALNDESNQQFISNMSSLINNEEFSDISILVGGQRIYCHRAILAAQCVKFRALLTGGMRECIEGEIKVQEEDGWSYDAFYSLITYIYTGRIPVDCERVDELLGLADSYTFDSLKIICEKILINKIDLLNCCYLLKIGDKFNANELKRNSLNFIIKNFDQVVVMDSFDDLSSVPMLLMEVTKAAARASTSSSGGCSNSGSGQSQPSPSVNFM
jgi:hypothetical protein